MSQRNTERGDVEVRSPQLDPGWGYRALVLAAIAATFALITLGGVVRVTESGLGCPDWPLCYGRVVPQFESYQIAIEYSHRLAGSLVSLLVVAVPVVAWLRYRARRSILLVSTLAGVTLAAQVALGGITVLLELPPAVVTVHLAVAQVLLALLLTTLVLSWPRARGRGQGERDRLFWWALIAVGATFAVFLSGSYVVGTGATAACLGWPLCDGGLLPQTGAGWVHMAHRGLAALGGIAVLRAADLGLRERRRAPEVATASALAVALLAAQVVVGAANPWTHFLWVVRALHLSLATALWGNVVALALLAARRTARVDVSQEAER